MSQAKKDDAGGPRSELSRVPTWEYRRRPLITQAQALRAAERLRQTHGHIPFYAKKAEAARLRGDEMAYWLSLQSSLAGAVDL
jgi:hypothetical protein